MTIIKPDTVVEKIRVLFKLWLSSQTATRSFCKKCGRYNTDFVVSDELWEVVDPCIRYGSVLCYDCFTSAVRDITGRSVVWELEPTE